MENKEEIISVLNKCLEEVKEQYSFPTMCYIFMDTGIEGTYYHNIIGFTHGETDIFHTYHTLINLYRYNNLSFNEDKFRKLRNVVRSKEADSNFNVEILDELQTRLKEISNGQLNPSFMTMSLIEFNDEIMYEEVFTINMDYLQLYYHHYNELKDHFESNEEGESEDRILN